MLIFQRFSFSRLDENDPGRRCSFVLNVNDEEKFAISDCQPALDSTEIGGILEEVNDTDSMAILATSMSKFLLLALASDRVV